MDLDMKRQEVSNDRINSDRLRRLVMRGVSWFLIIHQGEMK